MHGRITEVIDRQLGTVLAADYTVGVSTIFVKATTDLDETGALTIWTTADASEDVEYTLIDEDTGQLDLLNPTTLAHAEGDEAYVLPVSIERIAVIVGADDPDGDEGVEARVPFSLWDKIDTGDRTGTVGETVTADFDSDELVILDVSGQQPVVDGSYQDPDTVPPAPELQTDGTPPSTSPTPTFSGGPTFFVVRWEAIANEDPVVYDVHVAVSSAAFTPNSGTLYDSTLGTSMIVKQRPDETPLDYGTTYYVKIVARDADGSASASAAVAASMVQIDGEVDILASSVIADNIAARAVTAEKMESVMVMTSSLVAGLDGRVEVGFGTDGVGNIDTDFVGVRAYDPFANLSFSLDGTTGDAYMNGRIDFGNSRLLRENIVELGEVTLGGGIQVTDGVQAIQRSEANKSVATITWPSPTTRGNQLFLILTVYDPDGTVATPTTPSGWALEASRVHSTSDFGIWLYRNDGEETHSGVESITLNDTGCSYVANLHEYSGVDWEVVPDQEQDDAGGIVDDISTGTTATTAEDGELWLGTIAFTTISDNAAVDSVIDAGTSPDFVTKKFQGVYSGFDFDVDTPQFLYLATAHKREAAIGTANLTYNMAHETEGYVGLMVCLVAKDAGVATPEAGRLRMFNAPDRFDVPALQLKDDTGVERAIRPFQDVERRLTALQDFTGVITGVTDGVTENIDGMLQANSNGAASSIAAQAADAGHPGTWLVETGTATTGSSVINTLSSALTPATGDVCRMTFILKTPGNLSNGTQRYAVACGLSFGANMFSTTQEGAWVMYTDNGVGIGGGGTQNVGGWSLFHGDGTDLAADPLNDGTGEVEVAASTWYRIDIEHTVGVGTSVWIDGDKKVTDFALNMFAAGADVQVQIGIRKSLGSLSRGIYVDLVAFEWVMATSR